MGGEQGMSGCPRIFNTKTFNVFSFDGYLTGSVFSTLRSVVILRQCWKGFVV